MRYTIQQVPVAELPQVEVRDETRLADAVARLQNGEVPPPLILYKRKLYDGIHRIAAARQLGVTELPAAVCDTPSSADALRARLSRYPTIGEAWQALRK